MGLPSLSLFLCLYWAKTVPKPGSAGPCAVPKPGLVSFACRLSFASASRFHLQLHLRILLEHLGVVLAEQLRHPLVRHAAGAEPGSVHGAEIVNAEVRHLRPPQRRVPG